MAIDIEFPSHLLRHEDRHNDLGLGLQGTGEVASVFTHIVHYDHLPAGGGSPANTLVERNSRMWSHGSHKSAQHQRGRLSARFEHVKTNPVVLKHALVQKLADTFHQ